MKKLFVMIIASLIIFSTANASKLFRTAVFDLGFDIKLHLKAEYFNPKKHAIIFCKPAAPLDDWKGVCLIDGKPIFGTDWEMPKYALTEAYIEMKGKRIKLDTSCMYNPWFAEPNRNSFSAKQIEGGFLIEGSFSDGAGSYTAQWMIINGVSIRTKLCHKEC